MAGAGSGAVGAGFAALVDEGADEEAGDGAAGGAEDAVVFDSVGETC